MYKYANLGVTNDNLQFYQVDNLMVLMLATSRVYFLDRVNQWVYQKYQKMINLRGWHWDSIWIHNIELNYYPLLACQKGM